MAHTQESLNDTVESFTVYCRDCKNPSHIGTLIPVDDLHVQCPSCLYVFFMEPSVRKKL